MSRTIHEILDEYMEQVELVKQKMRHTVVEDILNIRVSKEDNTVPSPSMNEIRLQKFGWKIEIPNDYNDIPRSAFASANINYDVIFTEKPPIVGINETAAKNASAYMSPQTVAAYTVTKDEITFNGSPIADVISYDEKTGEVHYYERHWSTGDLIPDGTDPTGNRTAKSKGTVKVVKKYSDPSSSYPGYSGGDSYLGYSPDLNTDPSAPCGIDPNYTPWYPYGTPSFCETAQKVEFEFNRFDTGLCYDTGLKVWSPASMSVLGKLIIDSVDFGDLWTITSVEEQQSDLKICFVNLQQTPMGGIVVSSNKNIDILGLRGKATIAMGYPHIYKIVKIKDACIHLTKPTLYSLPWDVKQWPSGVGVKVKTATYPSISTTLTLLRKLC